MLLTQPLCCLADATSGPRTGSIPPSRYPPVPHAPRPHRRRAQCPRRARVRHLLAPAQRADRLPGSAGRRSDREPDRGSAPAPGVGRPRQGHLDLHQHAGRLDLRRPGDLRHDAVHQARRVDDLLRDRDVDGVAPADGRRRGQADVAAQQPHPDPPAVGGLRGAVDRHRDPRARDHQDARADRRDLRPPHGAPDRGGPSRHGARPLLPARRGAGVRPDRPRHRAPPERPVSALGKTERIIIAIVAVFTVLAGVAHYGDWPSIVAFVFATVALAGLAHVVSTGVESVGEMLGAGVAGFMQASLGNLPELFLVIFALREGEAIVAQSTVIGSIFSNALLVLGIVIVVGSRKAPDGVMRFGHRLANDTATLLIAATFIIVIVSLSLQTHDPASSHINTVSTVAAIALLVVYFFWVVPYIRGSNTVAVDDDAGAHPAGWTGGAGMVARAEPHVAAGGGGGVAVAEAQRVRTETEERPVPDDGMPHHLPLKIGIVLLAYGGIGAAFVSDWFVTALAPTVDQLGISRAFAGLVIAAIAGNAVENISAVILASKGQADLAVSVVKNSVGQMAAFMWPALVLISLPLASKLTFSLTPVYIGALLVTALAMWQITGDGEAVAFEGLALIAIYLTLAGITLYETI